MGGENGHVPAPGGWDNVFMAVAIDDDIDLHPKNKRLPASRLGWAAANLVYGQEDKPLQGPQLTEIQRDGDTIIITFDADVKLEALEDDRFMICCMNIDLCDQVPYGQGWMGVTIRGQLDSNSVILDIGMACIPTRFLAYLWLETPCSAEAACPLYSDDGFRLPVAPFKVSL